MGSGSGEEEHRTAKLRALSDQEQMWTQSMLLYSSGSLSVMQRRKAQ